MTAPPPQSSSCADSLRSCPRSTTLVAIIPLAAEMGPDGSIKRLRRPLTRTHTRYLLPSEGGSHMTASKAALAHVYTDFFLNCVLPVSEMGPDGSAKKFRRPPMRTHTRYLLPSEGGSHMTASKAALAHVYTDFFFNCVLPVSFCDGIAPSCPSAQSW
eukprot:CAMPEP_0194348312 /NCGR_PEP_ID=MMETSP0171-20130528/106469_1 /TAXON_ID=218684 /ORGANISM="Corethron pennatum, Strain L29A3" /LENGTH=157 /DNA_ID=CAMNT_0039115647 /DNA_START=116 /DNA_END=586 /DNA_ORIENTATION=-